MFFSAANDRGKIVGKNENKTINPNGKKIEGDELGTTKKRIQRILNVNGWMNE